MSNNMLTFRLVAFIGAQVIILSYPRPTIKERHSHSDVGTDNIGLLIETVSFSKVLADLQNLILILFGYFGTMYCI